MSSGLSIYQAIRGALQEHAVQTPGFPSMVSYENVPFSSTVGVPYARFTLAPQMIRPFDLKDNTKGHIGLFQVDIFTPSGRGTADAEILADAVRDTFEAGTFVFTADADKVKFDYAERAQALI